MTIAYQVVNTTIKGITRIFCRVDDEQLALIPKTGPLILVGNHVNFLDVPIILTHIQPRHVTSFVKIDAWDNPLLGRLFDLWGAIPLKRGEVDIKAFRQALSALEAGNILAIAPEGTRSGDGRLQRGHPGVVVIALRSGAPLLPLVYYGGEILRHNITRMKRTDFHIVVGKPFYIDPGVENVTRKIRLQITDQIMYQMAALLPLKYRGHYNDMDSASDTFLRFQKNIRSNLYYAKS